MVRSPICTDFSQKNPKTMKSNLNSQKYIYLWLALSLSMAFFLYSHMAEVFPGDGARWLMSGSNLQKNLLPHSRIASYLSLIIIIQPILIGILLDKLGIRLISVLLTTLYILTVCLLLHFRESLLFLRFLLTVGIAFVTVSYVKVIAGTLATKHFAWLSGLFVAVALLGSGYGDKGIIGGWFHYNWQQMALIAVLGSLLLGGLYTVLGRQNHRITVELEGNIRQTLLNSQNWLLAIYSGIALAPIIILGTFAGKPFFEEYYQYSSQQVIELGGVLLLGVVIGGPLIGFATNRVRRRVLMQAGILIQELTFIPLIYSHYLPWWISAILLFILGFASSVFVLALAIGREINGLNVMGTFVSLVKIGILTVIMGTELIFQKFLAWNWDGVMSNGGYFFPVFNYHVAFALFPVYLLVGFVLLLFINEPNF